VFKKEEVYQLPTSKDSTIAELLSGRELFEHHVTYDHLSRIFRDGAQLHQHIVEDISQSTDLLKDTITPLFTVTPANHLNVWTAEESPVLHVGDKIIGVIKAPV
jgi:hypothetical protein